jgi:hypothetical protein
LVTFRLARIQSDIALGLLSNSAAIARATKLKDTRESKRIERQLKHDPLKG